MEPAIFASLLLPIDVLYVFFYGRATSLDDGSTIGLTVVWHGLKQNYRALGVRATVTNANHSQRAVQALKALQFRRQLDRGDITHEEYLERLSAPDGILIPSSGRGARIACGQTDATGSGDSRQIPVRPKLVGAMEALQLRRQLEKGEVTPEEYAVRLQP